MNKAGQIKEQTTVTIKQSVLVAHPVWTLELKRMFDVLISLLLLILIWPLIAVVAIAIKLSSPGHVFYRGIRTGLQGKPFRILKLLVPKYIDLDLFDSMYT